VEARQTPVAREPVTPTPPTSRQLSASVVEAERFVLRGKTGQVRAELGVEPDQRAELRLRAPDGTLRAVLATADSGTGHVPPAIPSDSALLGLFDARGRRLASLEATETSVSLALSPSSVWQEGDHRGGIWLFAANKDSDVALDSDRGGGIGLHAGSSPPLSDLWLSDAQAEQRLEASISTDAPSVALFDTAGTQRAALGSVGLETTKTGATEQTAESSLVLFDKQGHVIFMAPPPR
jgi:hypothetical protein